MQERYHCGNKQSISGLCTTRCPCGNKNFNYCSEPLVKNVYSRFSVVFTARTAASKRLIGHSHDSDGSLRAAAEVSEQMQRSPITRESRRANVEASGRRNEASERVRKSPSACRISKLTRRSSSS